jgi:hypothetical protein
MFTLRLAVALPLLVLACTPDKSDTATDTSTDSTTGSSTDQPTSTGSTTDQPTSTTGSTTDPGTTTGEPVCAPGPAAGDLDCVPPAGTVASWQFLVDDVSVEAFDESCTIDEVTDDGSTQTFALTCAGSSAALALTTSSPHVALALDGMDVIQIEFATEPDGEVLASNFMLRDETDLLLAAGLDRWVTIPVTLDALNIGLRSTNCDGFLDEFGCFVIQRAAVEVTIGDQSVAVLGGNAGAVGEFQILVNDSTSDVCLFDDQCGFNYSPFSTSALFLRPGG